jgi:3-phosphoshikimate 1-carboxyvinyltransferase
MREKGREALEVPCGGVARGRLQVPPSKSITHRHLALALLAGSPFALERPLLAEDTELFLAALRRLGWGVQRGTEGVLLEPPVRGPDAVEIACGNAGTLLRLLTAALTAVSGRWRLDGSSRLRERPVGPLVDALRALGAEIHYLGDDGFAPLEITGGSLEGGETTLDAGSSSQFLSALLIAGQRARRPTRVRVTALVSAPYVAVTRREVARWGGRVEERGGDLVVTPSLLHLDRARVEGDDSAAAYPAAAAALTGGDVVLEGLAPDSVQGDRAFLGLLAAMGARVDWQGETARVRGHGELQAVTADLGSMPDQVPTLAALAPFARGVTRIVGVPHLRLKESDRLRAMAVELQRLGAPVRELADGLEVPGVWAESPMPDSDVTVETWGDHRIAMSLALVGLRRPGVRISEPEVVGKSYPGFWRDLGRLVSAPGFERG